MRLAGPAVAEVTTLNKAKRYRVARNPIHGYVVNRGTYIVYHVVHDFGGWPRSVDSGSHSELQRLY